MACTYVNLSITNYTNTQVASTYTLDVTPLTFVANLSSNNLSISDKKGLWDFGDGTVSESLSTRHVFKWPGIYNVTFYAYTSSGEAVAACDTFNVSAYNYIGNFIKTSYLGEDQITSYNAGRPTDNLTLTRFNSWQSYPTLSAEGYTVYFYASGSNSDYLDLEQYSNDPWGHLQAYFFFVKKQNSQYEILSSAKTTDDPIYVYVSNGKLYESTIPIEGSVLAGTSGIAVLNYVDQKPKNLTSEQPVLLFFQLDISKFPTKENILNGNKQKNLKDLPTENFNTVEIPVKIRYNPATKLRISSNGIDGEGYV
ncbi:PKD domain-containing protein, partial [bacterium]|nr:PKD domain-containing protein [bacterium]